MHVHRLDADNMLSSFIAITCFVISCLRMVCETYLHSVVEYLRSRSTALVFGACLPSLHTPVLFFPLYTLCFFELFSGITMAPAPDHLGACR